MSSYGGHKGHNGKSENEIAKLILDAAFAVHTNLGPGLLESIYEVVLAHELRKSGLRSSGKNPCLSYTMACALTKHSAPT